MPDHSRFASNPQEPRLFTRQPFKRLYTIFTLLTLPPRLLFAALYCLPRSLRPHRQWTFSQAFGRAAFAIYFHYLCVVEFRTSKTLSPGAEGERFITMDPADENTYVGILAQDHKIKPGRIGGMWYNSVYDHSSDAGKKVVIHIHGGAFTTCGVRPNEGGWGPEMLARHLGGFVLMPQYRLSSAGEERSRFPAALQDALTAYKYVLGLGVAAGDIVLSGDSAGGNLVLGMLRYFAEDGKKIGLPLPGAALLWGPWLDLSVPPSAIDSNPNAPTDYVRGELAEWAVRVYVPPSFPLSHPYISPLGNEFATSVPVFLQTGTGEVMYHEHLKFVDGWKRIEKNKIELVEIPHAPHDTFLAGQILGFSKEAEDAVKKAVSY